MGALDDGERVEATDAAAWRAWLVENHRDSKGAWLVRPRAGSGLALVEYEDAIRHALCFGWIDGPVRSFDTERGGLWFSPRRPNSGWAATNKARLIELEEAGLMTEAGRAVVEVAKANGSWTILDNSEALREPDDLAAGLDADPAARASWDAFPPSARKLGIATVDMARRPETRAARIAKIVADAAKGVRP
ncbi:YdeI/OmpD-associated family protein [Microbacterium aoyamense]|uniref:YdeI/OmpD-associated family protein n=1 Tax=Microbacterium aoyamense TaxID=344166 RepID=A0ABP5AYX2_9MICO|nr:YdeI/OmpD-associated family protein [Microbacterium aoyamense]